MDDNTFEYVWRDISDLNEVIPVSKGVITVKILRNEEKSQRIRKITLRPKVDYPDESTLLSKLEQQRSNDFPTKATPPPPVVSSGSGKTKYTDELRSEKVPRAVPPVREDPSPADTTNPFYNAAKASPSSAPAPAAAVPPANIPPTSAPDILNFDGDDHEFFNAPASTKAYQTTDVPDMMEFSSKPAAKLSSASTKRPVTSVTMDIDGDFDSSPLPSREELAARKNEQISEKVKGALEFKKEMDSKKEKSQQDFDDARQKHEEMLQNWAYNGKVRRNVRTLLSTAQNVLPSESKWKAVGLGDLLEPAQIKKQYRKAMLIVHPDHCITADAETQFICKRVFEAINEAYDEFLQKEGLS